MRLFRRTEFDGLVVATPQDLAWREDALRRRQDNESTTDIPAPPTSLAPTPPESATTVAPDVPSDAGVVSFSQLRWEFGLSKLICIAFCNRDI